MKKLRPLGTAESPAKLARRVDRLCDRFEAACQKGRRPRLERYLAEVPATAQLELLRELLVLELEYRAKNGESPTVAEYHDRFPHHAELVDAIFAERGQPGTPAPYLLRKWAANRLVDQLQMLARPGEEPKLNGPGDLSLLARIVSRTAGGDSRALRQAGLPARGVDPPTKLLPPGDGAPAEPAAQANGESPVLRVLGDYEVLDELGRGGMGVVYRARQRGTKRIVALKVIRPDQLELLSSEERQEWFERFRREVQIAACLEHDNLVAIYEVDEVAGEHFYSMRFVEGQSLAELLRKGPVANHHAAFYLEQVARALHALHLRDIVHRDLKPRNILIDTSGRPFLTDFGLAKWSQSTHELTHYGACVGTPEYMAPEQTLNAGAANAASDIYSLGATLYDMLTGRPPFKAADALETLRQVRDVEPTSPRRLNPAVHRDLALICLKCLEKEPHKRYGSALEVAEELRRYRTSEPLRHTRPVSRTERVWRWCKRKPAVAAASGLALVALTAAFVLSVYLLIYQSRVVWNKQLELANLSLDKGLGLCIQEEVSEGMVWLAHCLEQAPPGAHDLDRVARANLVLWSGKLNHLKIVIPSLQNQYGEGFVAVALSPDGRAIVTGSRSQVQRLDAATGKPLGSPLRPTGRVVAISHDGKTVLTITPETAQSWETDTGKAIGKALQHPAINVAAFSPDGTRVVTGDRYNAARLWQAATGEPLGPPLKHQEAIYAVSIGPDGKTIFSGSLDKTARLWDGMTGKPLTGPLQHWGAVRAVAFSPDGKEVLTGSDDKTAQLWSSSGMRIGPPLPHGEAVTSVAFSPDGQTLLTSDGKRCRLWDKASGTPLSLPLRHNGVKTVRFSPDGKMVLASSADTTWLWDLAPAKPSDQSLPHSRSVWAAIFSPDGKTVLTGSGEPAMQAGEGRLWDVATGNPLGKPLDHLGPVEAIAFSPDGKTMVTGSWDGKTKIWETATGDLRRTLELRGRVLFVAFSPDGNAILTGSGSPSGRGSQGGVAQLWDVATGRPLSPPLTHKGLIQAVAVSRSGDTLLTGSSDGIAQLWDARTGQRLALLQHQEEGWITAALFSPDGKMVLTAGADGTAKLWDAQTGQRLAPTFEHGGEVLAAAFTRDGKFLLTAGRNQLARLWEVSTGNPLGPPLQHEGAVRRVAFSPDGRLILTGSDDNTARLWDRATGKPLGPPLPHGSPIRSVAFSPDGKIILTACYNKIVRLWKLPVPKDETSERIVLRVKVSTGMEIGKDGLVHVMDAQAWKENRELLDKLDAAGEP